MDDARGLAEAILRFARDRDQRMAMSRQALESVRGFSQRRMHEEREAFLQTCLTDCDG